MIYILELVGIYILHLLLKLNWIATGVVCIYLTAMMRKHRKLFQLKKEQEHRFEEVSLYIDTLLYAFSKEGKILRAFEVVWDTIHDGAMKEKVGQAIDHMRLTFDESKVVSDSMKIIEEAYSCERITTMHRFMLHVEEYGGDISIPIELLLEDKNRWVNRIDYMISERKKYFNQIALSVLASLIICGIILYLPVMNVDISGHILVQIISVMVITVDDLIIVRAQKCLAVDWLTIDQIDDEQQLRSKLDEYRSYDARRGKKLSVVLAFFPAAGSVLALALGYKWIFALLLLMVLICVNQHIIGHSLMRKTIVKSIRCTFPRWLLDVSLLLQSENVHVAISKSIETAPVIIKEDVKALFAQIELAPEIAAPFHNFLAEFDIAEIKNAMGALYSMTIGDTSKSGDKMRSLISRNLALLDIADTERMKDKNSGMYILFLAPVLTASAKLLVDMAIFLLTFLSAKVV